MALDPVKNFAKVTVSGVGYDDAAVSIQLSSGHGSRLPQPSDDGSFNLTWWNATDYSDPSDDPLREIVRCTARAADLITVTRAQENTSASDKNTSGKVYQMVLSPTAKTITDIETEISDAADQAVTDHVSASDPHTQYQKESEKGQANGYASLGSDSKVPSAQLPDISITDTFVVASEVAMLALSAQVGDVAVRSDLNKTYILKTAGASVLANWQELLTPTDSVTSVNGETGAVTLDKTDIGLGSVDNTADADKPVSTDQQEAIDATAPVYTHTYEPKRTVIHNFQSGHGFTKQSAAGTQSDDTADFLKGSQSLKLVTDGDAAAVFTRKTGITAVDLTGKFLELGVKLSETAKTQELWVYASSDSFTNYYTWKITDDISQLKDGIWKALTLSFGKATVTGSPDRSAIKAVQLRIKDQGTGALTANFGFLNAIEEAPEGIVTVMFDDNWGSVYDKAKPIMDSYGFRGVIATIPARVGTAGYMTLAQLKQVQDKDKWDIVNHSYNHNNFTTLTEDQAEADILASRKWFRDNGFGAGNDHFAFPNGGYNEDWVLPLFKKYFRSCRTISSYSETLPVADPYTIRVFLVVDTTTTAAIAAAVTRAKTNKEWLILVYHKIVDTLTGGVTTEHLTASFSTEMADIASQGIAVRSYTDVLDGGKDEPGLWEQKAKYIQPRNNTSAPAILPSGRIGFGTVAPTSNAHLAKSVAHGHTQISGDLTLDETHNTIEVTSGSPTVTLPTAVGIGGREYVIVNTGTGIVTIDANGSETINGQLTYQIPNKYDTIRIRSNNANWIVLGKRPVGRWVKPYMWSPGTVSQAFTAGRVLLAEFEINEDCFVDQIVWVNGSAVSGNITVGIYGPVPTDETCLNAVAVYDSGNIAQSGVNASQAHTIASPVFLRRGRYYVAMEADNTTATYMRQSNQNQVAGWGQYYDRSGGYGALTTPCPAVTSTGSAIPTMSLRTTSL